MRLRGRRLVSVTTISGSIAQHRSARLCRHLEPPQREGSAPNSTYAGEFSPLSKKRKVHALCKTESRRLRRTNSGLHQEGAELLPGQLKAGLLGSMGGVQEVEGAMTVELQGMSGAAMSGCEEAPGSGPRIPTQIPEPPP